jgi:hypothetical protein
MGSLDAIMPQCRPSRSHAREGVLAMPCRAGGVECHNRVAPSGWGGDTAMGVCSDHAPLPVLPAVAQYSIVAITHEEVIRKILRHLKLSADPPPLRLPIRTRKRSTGSPHRSAFCCNAWPRGRGACVGGVHRGDTPVSVKGPFVFPPSLTVLREGLQLLHNVQSYC